MIKLAHNSWPDTIVISDDVFDSKLPNVKIYGDIIEFTVDNGQASYQITDRIGPNMLKCALLSGKITEGR